MSAYPRTDVSALYVMPDGPYPSLVTDWWDEARDARLYTGPNPVVAHPPCQLWTNFAELNYRRYGKESLKPGNDNRCFFAALWSVRTFGGVLEHPAFSRAWERYGLTKPVHGRWLCTKGIPYRSWHETKDQHKEWTCEVWQSAYGHKARKRTWLLYVGKNAPLEPNWSREPGTHQCGWFDRKKPVLTKKEAALTPKPFAEWLVSLAARSQ